MTTKKQDAPQELIDRANEMAHAWVKDNQRGAVNWLLRDAMLAALAHAQQSPAVPADDLVRRLRAYSDYWSWTERDLNAARQCMKEAADALSHLPAVPREPTDDEKRSTRLMFVNALQWAMARIQAPTADNSPEYASQYHYANSVLFHGARTLADAALASNPEGEKK